MLQLLYQNTTLKEATDDDSKAKVALIDAEITKFKKAINDCTVETGTDATAVSFVKTQWETFRDADKFVVTVEPYTAARTR